MQVTYPDRQNLAQTLKETRSDSLDFAVMVTAALEWGNTESLKAHLDECVRVLKKGGLLFVQGRPDYLPELGVYLEQRLRFKYWIAVESAMQQKGSGLPSVHAAVLLFVKGDDSFNVRRVRFPHEYCAFCQRTLKDWGGKAHLMNPEGYVMSDVWTALPPADNYTQLSPSVLDTILRMVDPESRIQETPILQGTQALPPAREVKGIVGPEEGIGRAQVVAESPIQYMLPGLAELTAKRSSVTHQTSQVSGELFDVVHCGDAVETLRRYPDNSVDLAFADPPYNLDKSYTCYDDGRENERYIAWCNTWLSEYVRVLKPSGSLYILNLPRWTMYHAAFLNQHLYFQNWIVWDALSEPRGKLMPAHYGLLFYTKRPIGFTFNYDEVGQIDARYYCLRASCIRKRKALGVDDKEPLTDFWWDIHRIKHRRDRDHHPCQLPETLMERIIRLSSNPGDVVLDALCGVGTTPVAALKLGRRYVAIDIDENYVRITKEKLAEVERNGYVKRESTRKPQRKYTKKELQLELRDLAARLGRLPTPEDVQRLSQYDVQAFFELFPTWGKALKAAKLEMKA